MEMTGKKVGKKKTRQEKWYSEDMFVRFKIISTHGKLKGIDPLKRIL